jgi:OmpA-OmpF porin, OOP family
MKTKAALLASSALLALALTAPAQAGNFYVTLLGGVNVLNDEGFAASNSTFTTSTLVFSPDSNSGFVVGGAVGLDLDQYMNGLRVEVEVAYRHNQVDGAWTSNSGATPGWSGSFDFDHTTFSVLANAWYDFEIGGLMPYFGGGIGWARTNVDGAYLAPANVAFDLDDSGFAWQAGAGVRFNIAPKATMGIGYRYLQAREVTILSPSELNAGPNTSRGEVGSGNHSVIVDVSYRL